MASKFLEWEECILEKGKKREHNFLCGENGGKRAKLLEKGSWEACTPLAASVSWFKSVIKVIHDQRIECQIMPNLVIWLNIIEIGHSGCLIIYKQFDKFR